MSGSGEAIFPTPAHQLQELAERALRLAAELGTMDTVPDMTDTDATYVTAQRYARHLATIETTLAGLSQAALTLAEDMQELSERLPGGAT